MRNVKAVSTTYVMDLTREEMDIIAARHEVHPSQSLAGYIPPRVMFRATSIKFRSGGLGYGIQYTSLNIYDAEETRKMVSECVDLYLSMVGHPATVPNPVSIRRRCDTSYEVLLSPTVERALFANGERKRREVEAKLSDMCAFNLIVGNKLVYALTFENDTDDAHARIMQIITEAAQ